MASILSKLKLPGAGADARAGAARRGLARPLPLIGHMPFEQQFKYLGGAIVLLVTLAALIAFFNARLAANNTAYLEIAGQMRMLTQRQAKAAQLAAQGNEAAFAQLAESRDDFARDLDALVNGGTRGSLSVPAASQAAQELLAALGKIWDVSRKNADIIVAAKPFQLELAKSFNAVNAKNAELLEASEQLVALLAQSGAGTRELAASNYLVMLTQRIAKNANLLHVAQTVDPEAAFLLSKDSTDFGERVRALSAGSDALKLSAQRNADVRDQLETLSKAFGEYQTYVVNVLQRLQDLVAVKRASLALFDDSEKLLGLTDRLIETFQRESSWRTVLGASASLSALLALALLLLLGKTYRDDAERHNQKTQDAILRLLNEMQTLADGDLTVQAQVTEDVTGAIADSVNVTVEELRALVTGVIGATGEVSAKTGETRQISGQLLEAAQRQAQEIRATSAAVLSMAHSLNEVSAKASESAHVAEQSLGAA